MQSTMRVGTEQTNQAMDPEVGGDRARMLEQWLCDPALPAPTLDEVRGAFGVRFGDRDAADAERLAMQLRFSLAILRDVFPTDEKVRRWLRAPRLELGGERPLDLLLAARIARLEQCALHEWSRASESFTSS